MKPQEPAHVIADRLGITAMELSALTTVRMKLATGELKHTAPYIPGGFNMGIWKDHYCDTAHCIGGWMQIEGASINSSTYSDHLDRLFFPVGDLGSLTSTQAVRAIDLFLEGNRDPWPQAVAEVA